MAVVVDFLGDVICTDVTCFRWLESQFVCKDCPITKMLNLRRAYFRNKKLMIKNGFKRDCDEQGEQGLAPEGV